LSSGTLREALELALVGVVADGAVVIMVQRRTTLSEAASVSVVVGRRVDQRRGINTRMVA
jgi:hypothetical protein